MFRGPNMFPTVPKKNHIVSLGPTQYMLKIPSPLDAAVSLLPVQVEFIIVLVSMKDNEKNEKRGSILHGHFFDKIL